MSHSVPAELEQFTPEDRETILRAVPGASLQAFNAEWEDWAHAGQMPPVGDWRVWVMMAGRGYGKTLSGAEWVLGLVRGGDGGGEGPLTCGRLRPDRLRVSGKGGRLRANGGRSPPHPSAASGTHESNTFVGPSRLPPSPTGGEGLRIALVAGTVEEARAVMVEGPSGILARARDGEVREWSFQRRTIVFANGAEATLFSGANPESLRGPEHDHAWCDELAKWRHAGATWDNLQLGLRRGTWPRALVTTTPRRAAGLRQVLGEEGVVETGGRSSDNPHVARAWLGAMERMHGGTMHGRQEMDGELLDEVEGALWPRGLIEGARVSAQGSEGPLHHPADGPPPRASSGRIRMRSVVIGVDPPAGTSGAACGIVAAGLGEDGVGYVLGDHSAGGLSPDGWARKVAGAVEVWGAAGGTIRVVAEANQGGAMVGSVLRGAGVRVPVKLVHATEGKVARAGPVAALFESGKAKFAGAFPELEDELAGLRWDGTVDGASPDRADAMVWALTALMLGKERGEPGVRML